MAPPATNRMLLKPANIVELWESRAPESDFKAFQRTPRIYICGVAAKKRLLRRSGTKAHMEANTRAIYMSLHKVVSLVAQFGERIP